MGITYNQEEKKFVFDFQHDGKEDIISLTGGGYQVEAFGKCFYYGYEFTEQVETSVRSAFIKYLKFTDALQEHPDLTNFIKKAVDDLDKQISLYNYDLVVKYFVPQLGKRTCASLTMLPPAVLLSTRFSELSEFSTKTTTSPSSV